MRSLAAIDYKSLVSIFSNAEIVGRERDRLRGLASGAKHRFVRHTMGAAKYLFIPNGEPPMPMYVVEGEPADGDFDLAAWSMLQIIRLSDRHRFEPVTGWGNFPFSMSERVEPNDEPSAPRISIAASSPTGLWRPLPPDFELPLNLMNLPRGVLEDYHHEVDAGNVHVHPDFYKPCPW